MSKNKKKNIQKIIDDISDASEENDSINDKYNDYNEIDDEINETEDVEDIEDIEDIDDTETSVFYNKEKINECSLDYMMDNDQYYNDNEENSEINVELQNKELKDSDKISSNRLTKYEMVRILGERTKQLTMGAKPLIKNYETLSYEKIAEEELKLNMTPFKIKRTLPNGKYEIWTLDELFKDHLLSQLE